MSLPRVLVILGTRPQAIKLAPVVIARRADKRMEARVCSSAQHRERLDQVLQMFESAPDVDLDLMRPTETLAGLTSATVMARDRLLERERRSLVLIQGDTTTAFCAALAAFY